MWYKQRIERNTHKTEYFITKLYHCTCLFVWGDAADNSQDRDDDGDNDRVNRHQFNCDNHNTVRNGTKYEHF